MREFLIIIRDILQIVFMVGFFCLFPLTVVGSVVAQFVVQQRQRNTHQNLAQAMGYSPLNTADHLMNVWYGGQHRGRRMAFKTFATTSRYYLNGRSHRSLTINLRLVMEVAMRTVGTPPSVGVPRTAGMVVSPSKTRGIPQTFNEAFTLENAPFISPASREAMLAFIYKGYPTGFRKDLKVRFTKGIRQLILRDRKNTPKDLLAPEILRNTGMILIFDYPDAGISPDQFQILLDELAAVAEAIETDRVSPLLAGHTPPKESKLKYAPWILPLFALIALPAISCICAFIWGLLNEL